MKKFSFLLMASLVLQSSGLVFLFANEALANTSITTNISSNTTWSPGGNTYIIENSVSVNSGVTLTIDPGTIIKFKATTTSLTVNGTLNALGSPNSKIYFTS